MSTDQQPHQQPQQQQQQPKSTEDIDMNCKPVKHTPTPHPNVQNKALGEKNAGPCQCLKTQTGPMDQRQCTCHKPQLHNQELIHSPNNIANTNEKLNFQQQQEIPVSKEGIFTTFRRKFGEQIHKLNEQTRFRHSNLNSKRELITDQFLENHKDVDIVKCLNQENMAISAEQLLRIFDRITDDIEKLEMVEQISDRVKFCTYDDLLLLLSKFIIPEYKLKALRYLQYAPPATLTEKLKLQIINMFVLAEHKGKAIVCLNS